MSGEVTTRKKKKKTTAAAAERRLDKEEEAVVVVRNRLIIRDRSAKHSFPLAKLTNLSSEWKVG